MGNLLDKIIDYITPKAHDAIDGLTEAWEEAKSSPNLLDENSPISMEDMIGLISGGVGGPGKIIKGGKDIISNILARNAKGLRNLRQGQGKGHMSLNAKDRAFFRKEMEQYRKNFPAGRKVTPKPPSPRKGAGLLSLLLGLTPKGEKASPRKDIGIPPKQY